MRPVLAAALLALPLLAGMATGAVAQTSIQVSLMRVGSGAVSELKGTAEFTVRLGRALVAGEIVDVPLSVSGTGVTTGDWSMDRKSGASLNTGVTLFGTGTATPRVRFSGVGARTATLELTPTADGTPENGETITVALGPDGTGRNGFDRAGLGTNVSGGADPSGSANSFDVQVTDGKYKDYVFLTASAGDRAPISPDGSGSRTFTVHRIQYSGDRIAVTNDWGFDLCFDGAATFGTDYRVRDHERRAVQLTNGCSTFGPIEAPHDRSNFYIDRMGGIEAFDETIVVSVRNPTPASVLPRKGEDTLTFTILGAQGPETPVPALTVTTGATSVMEGRDVTVTVTADPAPASDIEVNMRALENVGQVGLQHKGTAIVGAGETTGSWTFTTLNYSDSVRGDRTLTVDIRPGDGYTAGDPSSVTLDLLNDNPPKKLSFQSASRDVPEDAGTVDLTVTVDPAPSAPFRLDFTLSGTATLGDDYTIAGVTGSSGSVTVPASASSVTIPVTIVDDAIEDSGETIEVLLQASGGYRPGAADSVTLTIRNDDPVPVAPVGTLPAAHPLVKYASLVKSFHDRITANHQHGDSASGGWNKRFLKAMGHPDYVDYPQAAVTVADATRLWNHGGPGANTAWNGTVEAVTWAEQYFAGQVTAPTPASDPVPVPAVSIAAGSGVTEGGDATFVLTADPAPAVQLDVTVTVVADGDYGITAGTQAVAIPAMGSVTLTLATTGDGADEADGSVSVTVNAGTGYTVGSASTGTVAIADDDEPAPQVGELPAGHPVVQYADLIHKIKAWLNDQDPDVNCTPDCKAKWSRVLKALGVPEYQDITGSAFSASQADANEARGWSMWQGVGDAIRYAEQYFAGQVTPPDPVSVPAVSIAAGADVTEGGSASFVLTATPAPSAPLDVTVTVAATGDYGIADATQTVTIPTTGSATLTLATTGDDADEADGSVSVTVDAGTGYTVGSASSGTVAIADDDLPPPANTAPTVANAIPDGSATAGTTFAFQVAANAFNDADGDSLTYSATRADGSALPSWLAFAPGTRTFSGTPAAGDAGTLTVRVTASDGRGGSVFDDFDLTVSAPAPVPEITIVAGDGVTEGGSASFVLTATPAPTASLDVTVAITASGDYGITAGTRTVTIPTTGSATLTLATDNDGADEADGSVTATVNAGTGYTVGTASTGTVAIADDDVPAIAIAAGADVTEGGNATFTLSADPVPHAPLAVTVALTAEGAYGVTAGERTVTMPVSGTATLTVATTGDDTDEPDGSVTATVNAGAGYAVGSASTASVAVRDDDEPVIAAGPSVLTLVARDLNGGAPGHVTEGGTAEVEVRLNPAPAKHVSLYYRTLAGTAWTNHDFRLIRPTRMQFRPGETMKTIRVRTVNDAHDEGLEEFSVRVWPASADVTPKNGVIVTVEITNDDPMPAAYLARFGRTVAEQALDGIAGRMAASRTPGMQGSIAGQALNFDPAASGQPAAGEPTMIGATPGVAGVSGTTPGIPSVNRDAALAMADVARGFGASAPAGSGGMAGSFGDRFGDAGFGAPSPRSRGMTAGEALLGSSFSLTGQDGAGGSLAFWGRASQGSFDGAERGDGTDITLDGAVTTGMLGADYARGNWLVGLALTQSTADGGYAAEGDHVAGSELGCPPDAQGQPQVLCDGAVRAGDGDVEASLTAAIPWAALQASERLRLWGAAGYGAGEVTLKTAMGGTYSADTSWSMAAAGVRGDLLEAPKEGSGTALALTSDALWTRTSSDGTADLAASDSGATRLRLGLEGSWRMALEGGGSLTPKLEVGARHDGGDAETGSGVEVGGGIAWVDSGRGLSLDVSGRTLLAHENDDLEDRGFAAALSWDPRPATRRGLSLSLRQEFGGQAAGGLDALFAPAPLEDRSGSAAASRWAMEAAYGLPAFGGRFVGSPHAGLGLSTGARDWSVGWRLTPEAATAPDLSFGLRATRRESDTQAPEHTVGAEAILRW